MFVEVILETVDTVAIFPRLAWRAAAFYLYCEACVWEQCGFLRCLATTLNLCSLAMTFCNSWSPFIQQLIENRDVWGIKIISGGTKGGGGTGAFAPHPPTVGGSSPTLAPLKRKNWPKSAIFAKFLGLCPLRIAFCPLDAPSTIFLVPSLKIIVTLLTCAR